MLSLLSRRAEANPVKKSERNTKSSQRFERCTPLSCVDQAYSDDSSRKTVATVSYKSSSYVTDQEVKDEAAEAIITDLVSTPSSVSCSANVATQNQTITCGFATHRGQRCTQEDMYFVGQKCSQRTSLNGVFKEGFSGCFGIFDGHGGTSASQYCAHFAFRKYRELSNENRLSLQDTLYETIYALDTDFCNIAHRANSARLPHQRPDHLNEGSTCLLAVILKDQLCIANVGDSRAILCTHNGKAVSLTRDHKANVREERKRVKACGGIVTGHVAFLYYIWPINYFLDVPRVNGILSLSRSIGDVQLKSYITCEPDIITQTIDLKAHKFLIMATDGLWDVLSNKRVAQIADYYDDPQDAADAIVFEALRKNAIDNITVLVIDLSAYSR